MVLLDIPGQIIYILWEHNFYSPSLITSYLCLYTMFIHHAALITCQCTHDSSCAVSISRVLEFLLHVVHILQIAYVVIATFKCISNNYSAITKPWKELLISHTAISVQLSGAVPAVYDVLWNQGTSTTI